MLYTHVAVQEVKRKRLIFQTDPIPRSLIKLSAKYCGGRVSSSTAPLPPCAESVTCVRVVPRQALSQAVKTQAMQVFRDVLVFTRVRFHAFPAPSGHAVRFACTHLLHRRSVHWCAPQVLRAGVTEPLLRDEIVCQLMKQTSEVRLCSVAAARVASAALLEQNHHVESNVLAWRLLYMCLRTFAPSPELQPFLLRYRVLGALAVRGEHARTRAPAATWPPWRTSARRPT